MSYQLDSYKNNDYLSLQNSSLKTEEAGDRFDEILTPKDVSKYLKFSPKKIYRLCKNGEIPYKRIHGSYRFKRSEIDNWLKGELYE